MNIQELRALNVEQLGAKLKETRQELFNLRFQHATSQLEKTAGIPAARKTIARILTILAETGKKSQARQECGS
jgi:large subunit ribosomal protein L29